MKKVLIPVFLVAVVAGGGGGPFPAFDPQALADFGYAPRIPGRTPRAPLSSDAQGGEDEL